MNTRRVTQIVFLMLFLFLFLQARFPYEAAIDSDLFLRFSPMLPVIEFVQNFNVTLLFLPALIIIVLTIFLGRFFCGWICPLGTIIDIAAKWIKSPSNHISGKYIKLRSLKYSILLGVVILAAFSINIWSFFDPLAIFNRSLAILFYPLITLVSESSLVFLTELNIFENIFFQIYDSFKLVFMPEDQFFGQQILTIGLFFVIIIGLEKLSRRFWCRYICPAGALLGLLSQFRMYERIIGKECPACNKCQTECRMNAIPDADIAYTDKTECIECFSCGSHCPPGKKPITYRWRWKPYHTPVNYDRRQFIYSSMASIIGLGMISLGFRNTAGRSQLIRPPGAVPEEKFLEKCIRCLQCVRICASNGACLQPDHIYDSVLELWAPVAVMRSGYCEYNCNLCGQVCPTEAILPLDLNAKQKLAIGLAYFDKNRCIPYLQHKDCIVCEEHCPTPDKAIKFEIKEIALEDASIKKVKYPYVVRELCIGCGICETKCPVPGVSAIIVTNENQIRLQSGNGTFHN